MAVQKQDDQHEHTFSNYVRIQDVVLKTCLRRWTIGKSDERGSGISVLLARHDDDDDDIVVEDSAQVLSTTGLNLETSYSRKAEKSSLPNNLSTAGRKKEGFTPFQIVLARNERQ